MVKILRPMAVTVLALVFVAGCGGGDSPGGGTGNGDGTQNLVPDELEGLDVDNCSLLTDQEVSALAGEELVVAEDTPLGCGWVIPGEPMHQFGVQSYRGDGDSSAAAMVLVDNPEQIIDLDGVGDDAVAVSTYGEVINWVIARKGNLFVVINQGFLGLEPTPSDLDRSGELAATALGRLVDAA